MGIDLGIALGSAANAGLGTYERIQKMRSEKLQDQQRQQQLDMGEMQLQDQREKQAALQSINDITREFQYGPTVDRMNAGDPTPGIDQSSNNPQQQPNLDYLTNPVKFQQYQQKIAPFITRALGPEKGLEFMKNAQMAVANNVPLAAMALEAGDVRKATDLLRASPLFGNDLQSVTPVLDDAGKTIGWHANFGNKGTLPLDTAKLKAYALAPGDAIKVDLDTQRVAATKEQAAAATAQAAAHTKTADIDAKKKQAELDAGLPQVEVDLKKAQAGSLNENAASQKELRGATAEWRRSQAANGGMNWSAVNTAISKAATENDYTKRPDPNGDKSKTVVDWGRVKVLRTAAERLARADPEMAKMPAMAVDAAVTELKRIEAQTAQQVEAEAADKKKGEPGLFDSGTTADYYKKMGVKNLDEWKKNRANELRELEVNRIGLGAKSADSALASAPSAKSGAAVSGTIKGAAAPAGTPAKPTTKAEYDALPPNTPYIDPGDNKVHYKKG